MNEIKYEDLKNTDLIVDAKYLSDNSKDISGEVISKLLSVGNSGGFRKRVINKKTSLVAIYTSGEELEWRDEIDRTLGTFIYWGDNRKAGNPILNTKAKGNEFLQTTFEYLLEEKRNEIPPIFIFKKYAGREVVFLGLAVLGANNINMNETLKIVWAQNSDGRYQNYKAIFTILDEPIIKREWINDILDGKTNESKFAPKNWIKWVNTGKYIPLISEKNPIKIRTKNQQLPDFYSEEGKMLLKLYEYFEDGYAFERCAIEIIRMMDNNIISIEGTSFFKDHGKDAVGTYRIGNIENNIEQTFVVEAKRYNPKSSSGIGVKTMSRLVSRIKHREFGIMITTSHINSSAYEEVVDEHLPIIIISGKDIIEILVKNGIKNRQELQLWLEVSFERTRK